MPDEKEKESTRPENTAIVQRHESFLDIEPSRAKAKLAAIRDFQGVVQKSLNEGTDYGKIPGCGDTPTLLKPGAEKIIKLLNLYEEFEFIERIEDWDRPLFHYLICCTLRDMASGTKVASGLGECNSRESRYRYRWVNESQVTEGEKTSCKKKGGKRTLFEPKFAVEKKETTGQYGQPAEYWAKWDAAIANRTARSVERKKRDGSPLVGWEIDVDTTLYQVENPEIYDQVNTMVKIGKKRSLVDAALSVGRLSELFTQDLEDFQEGATTGSWETTTTPKSKPGPKPQVEKPKAEPVAAKPTPKPAPTVSHEAPKPVKDEFTFGPEVGGDPPEWKAKAEPAPAAEEEFPQVTPPPAPTPLLKVDSPGATMAQMEKFAKIKVSLDALGINEETLWKGIHRFSERTFKKIVVEASEFTPTEMDYILGYMDRWVKAMEAEKVARAAAEKRRQGGQS